MSEKWIPKLFDKILGPNIIRDYPHGINPLTWRYYKRNYACIPLVAICVADYSYMVYCSIMAFVRTDIRLTRNSPSQNELYDLLIHPVNRKFRTYFQTFPPQPELHKTYMDMIAEENRRKEECECK
ncbi:unnamed protein product [Callosobruchus maculatus]|uniref:Uncharacterized protein n=1 Tax=Callosobruchus maculatus TaxID=64391 RepID=A0A653D047_CALMS|nr:unnamed protein product [Callosobruchus maculatus]